MRTSAASVCQQSWHLTCVFLQYAQLYNITLGNHEYEKNGNSYTPLQMCQTFYRNGTVYPSNESFEIDAQMESGRFELFMQMHENPKIKITHF